MTKFSSGHRRSAKLTGEQVLSLRERYHAGESQGALARAFGISVGQVGRIVRGESWQRTAQVEDAQQLADDAAASLARLRAMQEHPLPSEAIVPPEGTKVLERFKDAIAQEKAREDALTEFVKPKNPYY